MSEHITLLQAYKSMFQFLENYYFQMDKPDQLGSLLGELQLLGDERPADPAAWDDWLEAVQKVLEAESPNQKDEPN
jgi:hypothetical protein